MKCDDFIAMHESDSALSRLRARRHARRCPRCAVARDWLNRVRDDLAASSELSAYHRRVWEGAAVDNTPEPARRWFDHSRLAVAGGLAIAAILLVALVLSLPDRDVPPERNIAELPPAQAPKALPLRVPPAEIARLELELDQVAADLERLADEAARLEARRAINELSAMYQPLG